MVRVPSTYAGRAVPSGGRRPPDHPASAFPVRPGHPSPGRVALAVFVPRAFGVDPGVCAPFVAPIFRLSGGAARAGHSWPVSSNDHVPGPRPGSSRGLAGARWGLPGDVRGICCRALRSVDPTARVSAPRQRLGPTCRFAGWSAASSFDAGSACWGGPVDRSAAAPGLWPRGSAVPCDPPAPPWLLRGGPESHPSAGTALGFAGPLSGIRPPASGPPLPVPVRPWGFRLVRRDASAVTGRVAASRVPFGVVRGRRLVGPDSAFTVRSDVPV